jgi:hypothetical protein
MSTTICIDSGNPLMSKAKRWLFLCICFVRRVKETPEESRMKLQKNRMSMVLLTKVFETDIYFHSRPLEDNRLFLLWFRLASRVQHHDLRIRHL